MNDVYNNYNLEDFLTDDAFIDWVLSQKDEEQWQRWLSQNPSVVPKIEEAKNTVKSLRFKDLKLSASQKDRLWQRIDTSTQAKEVQLPQRRKWVTMFGVAASIALLGIVWFNRPKEAITTDIAETREIVLPFNSTITMGPQSEITYDDESWAEARAVTLDGQAHFSVTKGNPFTVTTDLGQVRVLGTEFDVYAENGSFLVKVDEGKVQATSGRSSHILTAKMSFYLNPKVVDAAFVERWKVDDMRIIFNSRPLSEVVESLALVTSKSFETSDINMSQPYSGTFNSTQSLNDILKQIFWPLQISYEIEGDTITLN